jgi:hypothetical protein
MRTEEAMRRLEAANPIDPSDLENWPTSDRGDRILRRAVSAPLRRIERHPHRRRFPRLVLPAVAVITIVVIAVLFVPVPGTRQGASAAAAEVLHAAARVAEGQPQTPMPADGYRYRRSKDAYRSYYDACSFPGGPGECPAPPPNDWEFSVLVPHTREIWVAPDGSGRLLVTTGERRFLGPRDEATWEAAGRPQLDRPGTSDETFGPDGLSFTDFSEYSTDPDELYDQIRSKAEGYGPSTDAEMLVLVGDLLREPVAPPDLRAALFRVAARIPGVELVGEVTDPAGRKGTAVARTSDDAGFLERNELVFDPETSELLAEREVLLERVDWIDAEPGTVIGYAVYLNSGVVGSTSKRP